MESLRLPQKLPFSKATLPKKVIISYVLDYVVIIVLAILFLALDAVEPFHQPFSLQNYTLHYPYAVHERVPAGWCYVIVVICPAIIICFWTLVVDGLFSHQPSPLSDGPGRKLGRYRLKDRLWELNCGLLGLCLSEGAAFVITGTFKNAVGKPRPDLVSRCMPREGSKDPAPWGLSNYTICTQTDHAILKDGFRSFPSGHSSSSFAGLFYLSLYLAAKLHIWDSKGEVWKVFVVIIPTIGAGLIAASRIMDARHHPFDVITGSLLGVGCAYAAYRQYFPPVSETWRKGRAHPIRSWGREPVPPESVTHAQVQRSAYRGVDDSAASDAPMQPPQRSSAQHTRNEGDVPFTSFGASYAPRSAQEGPPLRASSVRQQRMGDEYESSDETEDDYELQSTYTLSNPQGPGLRPYDPLQAGHGGATAYRSQVREPPGPGQV